MSATISPWNTASEIVIDALVAQVKSTGRWSRDGRSLRLLNRHWCAALNRRVIDIQPHSSRVLRDKDINSLLKFPNVTALDTTLFEGKEKALLPEKCLRIGGVVHRLPYLRRLVVGRLFDFLNKQQVNNFPQVTSLKFNLDTSGKNWLSTVAQLPLVELLGEFEIKNLNAIVSDIRSLKILDRAYAVCSSDEELTEFVLRSRHLRAISLCCDTEHVNIHVGRMTNLVSLWIYGSDLTNFGPLTELPRNTALSFRFEDGRIFKNPEFKECLRYLGSLEISGENEDVDRLRLPNDMLTECSSLERLKLEGCLLDDGLFTGLDHRRLKALSLQRCVLPNGFSFVDRLGRLEDLDLEEHPDHEQMEGLSMSSLHNLKRLRIRFDGSTLTPDLLSEIVRLGRLEYLNLGNCFELRDAYRFPVREFEPLGDLPNFSKLILSGPSSKKVVEQIICLEMLPKLEELSMRMSLVPYDDLGFIKRELKALKLNAPHLKLTFGCCSG